MAQGVGVLDAEVDADAVVRAASAGGGTAPGDVVVPDLPGNLRDRIDALAVDGDLGEVLALLASDLVGFQDTRCAADFLDAVAVVHGAEERVAPGSARLTEAVARGLHKLTAYKDEYEVARLLVGPEARAAAESVGGPGARATWHLHPPLLQALGMGGKLRVPAGVGRPVMRLMAAGRRLRGTPFDPFGRTEVRRLERALVAEYRAAIATVAANLSAGNLDEAVDLAASAMDVRGYERLKLERGGAFREGLERRLAAFA